MAANIWDTLKAFSDEFPANAEAVDDAIIKYYQEINRDHKKMQKTADEFFLRQPLGPELLAMFVYGDIQGWSGEAGIYRGSSVSKKVFTSEHWRKIDADKKIAYTKLVFLRAFLGNDNAALKDMKKDFKVEMGLQSLFENMLWFDSAQSKEISAVLFPLFQENSDEKLVYEEWEKINQLVKEFPDQKQDKHIIKMEKNNDFLERKVNDIISYSPEKIAEKISQLVKEFPDQKQDLLKMVANRFKEIVEHIHPWVIEYQMRELEIAFFSEEIYIFNPKDVTSTVKNIDKYIIKVEENSDLLEKKMNHIMYLMPSSRLEKIVELVEEFSDQKQDLLKMVIEHFEEIILDGYLISPTEGIAKLAEVFPEKKQDLFQMVSQHFQKIISKVPRVFDRTRYINELAKAFPEKKQDLFQMVSQHFDTIILDTEPCLITEKIRKLAADFPENEHKKDLLGWLANNLTKIITTIIRDVDSNLSADIIISELAKIFSMEACIFNPKDVGKTVKNIHNYIKLDANEKLRKEAPPPRTDFFQRLVGSFGMINRPEGLSSQLNPRQGKK